MSARAYMWRLVRVGIVVYGASAFLAALLAMPPVADAATQYELGRQAIGCTVNGIDLGSGTATNYENGALRSTLTTAPASMPLLTLPGSEVGCIVACPTTQTGYPNYWTGGAPQGLTATPHTPEGPWCMDWTMSGLSLVGVDERNDGSIGYVYNMGGNPSSESVGLLNFGIVREPHSPTVLLFTINPIVWPVWSDPYHVAGPGSGYYDESVGGVSFTNIDAPGVRQSYAAMQRQATIHAYGGSFVATVGGSPVTRYWWHARGSFAYYTQWGSGATDFTVEVPSSTLPPSVEVTQSHMASVPLDGGGYNSGNCYKQGAGGGVQTAPNWYGAPTYYRGTVWQAVGGYSEDTATVAYYMSKVDPDATAPLAPTGPALPSPTTPTSGSVVPTTTDPASGMPQPPDWTTLLNPLAWGSYIQGAANQLSTSFQAPITTLTSPFTALQSWKAN